jgi:hypothetical protein
MRVRGALVVGLAVLLFGGADARAAIGPGVLVEGCTSNFVFRDATDLYLGYAAHCEQLLDGAANDPGEPLETHECAAPTREPGAEVQIEGASAPGRLAYSSWHTMLQSGEKDVATCDFNDFALVRIDPRDHHLVDPSVPFWGGPTGLRRAPVESGETAVSFGRSDLRGDIEALMPREGYFLDYYDEWHPTALFVTAGVFGDSGSAVLDGAGGAVGVLTNLEYEPPGANGITNLARALDYMRSHGGPDAHLVNGTAPFSGARVPTLTASPGSVPDPAPSSEPPAAPPASAPASASAAPPPPASKPAVAKRKAKRKPCRKLRTRKARRRCAKRRR